MRKTAAAPLSPPPHCDTLSYMSATCTPSLLQSCCFMRMHICGCGCPGHTCHHRNPPPGKGSALQRIFATRPHQQHRTLMTYATRTTYFGSGLVSGLRNHESPSIDAMPAGVKPHAGPVGCQMTMHLFNAIGSTQPISPVRTAMVVYLPPLVIVVTAAPPGR